MNLALSNNIHLMIPSYFEWSLLLFAFVILSITLVLTYHRLGLTLRYGLVAFVNVVSFATLVGLLCDVHVLKDKEAVTVLLTGGTSQAQVNSLVKSNSKIFALSSINLPENSSDETLDLSSIKSKLTLIEHEAEMVNYLPSSQQLHVYGDGLNREQWQNITALVNKNNVESSIQSSIQRNVQNKEQLALKVNFFPSAPRTGPFNLHWQKQLILGQPFKIEGQFKSAENDKNRIFTITLTDHHNNVVDELRIKNNERFSLSSVSKNHGMYVYQLKVFDDEKALILTEPVAFTVNLADHINVVIKQSSPSFETKHLVHWLAEQGENVLVLTQISKDKFTQHTYNNVADLNAENEINISSSVDKRLDATWLQHFDLLYLDGRALLALSENEVNQLEIAIAQGLGVIVIVDNELLPENSAQNQTLISKLFKTQPMISATEQPKNTVVRWPNNQEELALESFNAKLALVNGNVLIKGSEQQALSVSHHYGLGKVAFSLLNRSYQWAISGEKTHYSQYWQYLISHIARQNAHAVWQPEVRNRISFLGEMKTLCAQLTVDEAGKWTAQDINLLPSLITESNYCGSYWANASGWQTVNLIKSSHEKGSNQKQETLDADLTKQHSFYIYTRDNWSTWQQDEKHKASFMMAKQNENAVVEPDYVPLNKQWFWWLLFFCLSSLWLERKLF